MAKYQVMKYQPASMSEDELNNSEIPSNEISTSLDERRRTKQHHRDNAK